MKRIFLVSLSLMMLFAFFLFSQDQTNKKKRIYDSSIDDSDLFKKHDKAVFVNAEFLYWTADTSSLDYAFKLDPVNVLNNTRGKNQLAEYDWDPCFRVSLGWFNAPNTWQIYGQYTWLRISGSDNLRAEYQDGVSNFLPVISTSNLGRLELSNSKIKFFEDLGDLLVSRVFVPNYHLRLRLMGGFTAGRLKEEWKVYYLDILSRSKDILYQLKFTGIGFRAGLDFDWFWSTDFYLSGKMTTALMIGKYKYLNRIFVNVNDPDPTIGDFDLNFSQYRGVYNIQFLLGPSYQRSFEKNRFEIFAGYELNSWINFHDIFVLTSGSVVDGYESQGMFLLHGLTVKLNVDF